MIKKIFSALVVVLFAASVAAQSGLTCEDPIPVDNNFVGDISEPGEYWFTANTYDLPLNVHFSPLSDNSDWGPEVYVDFTCTPGVYENHKLDSVINGMTNFGLELPVEFVCDKVVRNGKVEWDLSINENYRENLTRCGITENVKAFVRVYFSEPGTISLRPDTAYTSCMQNSEYVALGDTFDIAANDADRVFILPFSEWKKENIQFTWIGDGSANVWISDVECEFTPVATSAYVKAQYTTSAASPYTLQSVDVEAAVENWLGGGVYFAKVMARSAGKLVVERIPLGPIQGDAILLKHGESVQLQANDNRVFCFPKTWRSTEFLSSSSSSMEMYVAKNYEFELSSKDANVIEVYNFVKENTVRILQLSTKDIATLGASATDDYLYVRFKSDLATTITPNAWSSSSCASQSILLSLDTYHDIAAKSSGTLYRLNFADLQGYDFTITWTGNSRLPMYIADTCEFMLSSADSHVLWNANIASRGSRVVEASVSDTWANRVGDEGYLYVRFNPTNQGSLKITSDKPEDTLEPIYTTINEVVCDGGTYTWEGTTYAISGVYTKTFVAANGADSIVTLNLTIRLANVPTTEKVTVRYDEPYAWNGVTYTESGSYTVTLSDAYGCDSVATLELTVLEKSDVKPNDNLVLNLASAFKVYSMEHLSWVAQDVTLNWGGTTPLYVFIAKNKTFSLAPYNRYVLHLEEIPAGGSWLLTKEQMALWATHADADGQLYVRFLTEEEGVLTTEAK